METEVEAGKSALRTRSVPNASVYLDGDGILI